MCEPCVCELSMGATHAEPSTGECAAEHVRAQHVGVEHVHAEHVGAEHARAEHMRAKDGSQAREGRAHGSRKLYSQFARVILAQGAMLILCRSNLTDDLRRASNERVRAEQLS
jgi:hypothetical protein